MLGNQMGIGAWQWGPGAWAGAERQNRDQLPIIVIDSQASEWAGMSVCLGPYQPQALFSLISFKYKYNVAYTAFSQGAGVAKVNSRW